MAGPIRTYDQNGPHCRSGLLLLLLCALGACLILALPPRAWAEFNRLVVIAGDNDYPPYSFLDNYGQPAGLSVDLTRAVAQAVGLRIELRLGPWSEVRKSLETGQVDAIMGMLFSEERNKLFDYTPPYSVVTQSLFVRRGGPRVSSLQDLAGRRVVVQHGDIMHDFLLKYGGELSLVPVGSTEELIRALAEGRGDCAATAKMPGLYWLRRLGIDTVHPSGPPLTSMGLAMTVRKGNHQLLAQLTEGLSLLHRTGEFQELQDRWLGVLEEERFPWSAVLWVTGPLALFLLLAVFWSWSLRRQVRLRTRNLAASENRFRTLVDSLGEGVMVQSATGALLEVNRVAVEVFDITDDALSGQPAQHRDWGTVHEDGSPFPAAEHPSLHTLHTGEPCSNVIMGVRHRQRGLVWIKVNTRPLFEMEGSKPLAAVISFSDITDAKHKEAALQESEEQYRQLFESSKDPILIHDPQHDGFLAVNPAAVAMYQYSREEFATLGMAELLASPEEEALQAGPLLQTEYRLHRKKSGELFPVRTAQSPMRIRSRQYECIIVQDMTAQADYERMLLTAKEAAEAANRAKSDFLANMSHEIRTPLNGVMGMLQLLKTTPLAGEQAEFADTALQSCRRLTTLLSDILDLSRIEAGKMSVVSAPFCLHSVLEQLRDLFKPIAKESGLALHINTAPDIPHQLLGDATRLQQVLINLLGNALKFTPAGSVSVEAYPLPPRRKGQYRVLFCITDTGIGIPDDKLELLFRPFSQVSEGYTRNHQGAGLGLAISKRLVELMDGNMAVESEPGVGTSLYFCATFERPDAEETEAGSGATGEDAELHPGLRGLRALVAEDDTVSGEVAAGLLRQAGLAVSLVMDGLQVLEFLRREPVDLVFMDVQMPILDGVAATRAIRDGQAGEDRRHVPIIAVTSYAMAGDQEAFLAAGMNGYVAKPVGYEELLQAVTAVLGSRGQGTPPPTG